MQKLIYVRHVVGTSKKNNPYDLCEVSNGISSFTLNVDKGATLALDDLALEEGDEFMAEVHVSQVFGALRGSVMDVEPAT